MGTLRATKTGAADFVISLAECRLGASLADLEFVLSAGCDFSDGRVGMSESVTPPDSLSERAEAAMCRVVQSVLDKARRTGTPVVLWQDEQIQLISPDELERQLTAGSQSPSGCAVTPGVIELAEAGARLSEIISALVPGDEVTIIEGGEPIAVLQRVGRTSWPCQPGTARGSQR